MRRRVSTLLEERTCRRTRLEAARQGRQISDIVGEALNRYLSDAAGRPAQLHVVADSWGVMRVKPALIKRLLRDEPGILKA